MAATNAEDPFWTEPEMVKVLVSRDIAGLYQRLQRRGVSQRVIAALTGQSQSEISEILAGRRVASYDVLQRVAEGIGIPRGNGHGLQRYAAPSNGSSRERTQA